MTFIKQQMAIGFRLSSVIMQEMKITLRTLLNSKNQTINIQSRSFYHFCSHIFSSSKDVTEKIQSQEFGQIAILRLLQDALTSWQQIRFPGLARLGRLQKPKGQLCDSEFWSSTDLGLNERTPTVAETKERGTPPAFSSTQKPNEQQK